MKISTAYRFLAAVLSLSILIGISVPAGLHAMSDDICKNPAHATAGHGGEQCPMDMPDRDTTPTHHKAHDFGFACACSVDEAPLKTQAQTLLKISIPDLPLTGTAVTLSNLKSEASHAIDFTASVAYSPPPIYLVNEVFIL